MSKIFPDLTLYAITDRGCLNNISLKDAVLAALKGGATLVQLREKKLSHEDFVSKAIELKALCHSFGVPLIINDNVSVCIESGADGVHLGQSDMDPKEARSLLGCERIIGVTAKTVEQAKKAAADGADYIGSGAVFGTVTKSDAKKMDMETLKSICAASTIPVTAIGGICAENIMSLRGSGISGVAVVSGIFAQPDIEQATELLKRKSESMLLKTALTIAGSDCSGGAGIQADLKTMTMHGVFGMSAVTSITAQNTSGVAGVYDVSPDALKAQLDMIFTDIFPDSVKIGMVSSAALIHVIADTIKQYRPGNIVLDPVMVSTSGHSLLAPDAVDALTDELFPLADIITPNAPEAAALCGYEIRSEHDMERAAKKLRAEFGTSILLKGGHINGSDLLCSDNDLMWFRGEHIDNPNTHGTGCTLSSAIASNLAKGYNTADAVRLAKEYISGAIRFGAELGHGRGPVNHMWRLPKERRKNGYGI